MPSIRSKVPQLSIVVLLLLIFALASAQPAAAADVAGAPAAVTCNLEPGPGGYWYVVQRGDYLSAIGQACGVYWVTIANNNNIVAPYVIYPGQYLYITAPTGTGGPGSGGLRTYVVQPGDWLWKIGRALGINPLEIARVNGLTVPYTIYPGQVLILP